MAKPTSGIAAWGIPCPPPLSASDDEPAKASTLGMRSATSLSLVEAFCWSSSASRLSERPQIPPAELMAPKSASTAWDPWAKLPCRGPVMPLTLPKVMADGVTPGPDAVLPALPGQSFASADGLKLKPAEVGDASPAAGVAEAAAAAAGAGPVDLAAGLAPP